MKDLRTKYGEPLSSIVIKLNGLADDAYRESDSVDNLKQGLIDALVQLQVKVTAGAPAGDKNCLIYAYGSAAGGTPFSGGAKGQDGAFGGHPGQLITNCPQLGIVTLDAVNEVFTSDCFSIASAFGGVMPEDWGIIVMDQSGRALASKGNKAWYQGILAES